MMESWNDGIMGKEETAKRSLAQHFSLPIFHHPGFVCPLFQYSIVPIFLFS
jgi:hypothetical protein